MNREILFRGKRKDTGEWVIGHYSYSSCGVYHFISGVEYYDSTYQVLPETIGQFTGLLDTKGKKVWKKVWEGSILKDPQGNKWETDSCIGYGIVVGNKWDNLELLKGGYHVDNEG